MMLATEIFSSLLEYVMGRVTKATVQSVTLKHISQKLDHIHKDVEQNTKDIVQLKEQVAMGKVVLK